MSVVVETPEGLARIITKGAADEVFRRCHRYELHGRVIPLDQVVTEACRAGHDELSREGFRVLALAYRDLEPRPVYTKEDESGLVLRGFIAFLDPPKDSAAPAVEALRRHGVALKVLTGDNEAVSRKICREVGLPLEHSSPGSRWKPWTMRPWPRP
jgi:Mg2+-importing ATPase